MVDVSVPWFGFVLNIYGLVLAFLDFDGSWKKFGHYQFQGSTSFLPEFSIWAVLAVFADGFVGFSGYLYI